MNKWAIQALMLLTMVGSSASAISQSIDNCMLADDDEAVSICTRLLDNGTRSVDVYFKLSSELYELKRINESRAKIDRALDLHPGNSELVTLREVINSNRAESERLTRSAVKNASGLDPGRAKFTCLVQRSSEALAACRRHLELTSDDRDRILSRIAVLEQEFSSTDDVEADVTQIASVKPVPDELPVESNDFQNARAERYRSAVRRVQQLLNDLSFPTGLPDGLPGSQTRSALASFYRITGLPRQIDFDADTINTLQEQKDKLDTARGLLAKSRLAVDQGDLDSALTQLQRAGNISRLLDVPAGYREELESRLEARDALFEPAVQTADATLPEDSAKAHSSISDVPAKVAPVDPGNAEFDILMRQIATLEQQLEFRQNAFDVQWQKVRATALVVMNRYW